jgi:DNA polymerase-3 subunit epsilon
MTGTNIYERNITKLLFVDTETTDRLSNNFEEKRNPGVIQISGEIVIMENVQGEHDPTFLKENESYFTDRFGKIFLIKNMESFDYRLNVFGNDTISEKALEVNEITLEQIKSFPNPRTVYTEIINMFSKYVNKFDRMDKFQLVAYNAQFDDAILREFFRKNNDSYYVSWISFPPLDVVQQAIMKFFHTRNRLQDFKQATIAKVLDIKIDGMLHDAKFDIELCKKIFFKLL